MYYLGQTLIDPEGKIILLLGYSNKGFHFLHPNGEKEIGNQERFNSLKPLLHPDGSINTGSWVREFRKYGNPGYSGKISIKFVNKHYNLDPLEHLQRDVKELGIE